MTTISSKSTDAEVWAAYDDNASYAEEGSPAKCRAFITACRVLLRRTPRATRSPGNVSTELAPELIQQQLEEAQRWLASFNAAAAGGGSRYFSFENFRD